MGSSNSKKRENPTRPAQLIRRSTNNILVLSEGSQDEYEIKILRDEIENQTDLFLLNQLLLSVVFFQNYNRQLNKLSRKKVDKTLNHTVLEEHQKSCIKPDNIADLVDKCVSFKPRHGPNKGRSEPLLPRRMYLIHDNIELILHEDDDDHYSGIDKPSKALICDKTENKGFTFLKYLNDSKRESASSILSKDDSMIINLDKTKLGDEEQYDYSRINNARTPKPLININNLSQNTPRVHCSYEKVENYNGETVDNFYTNIPYLDSKKYMTQCIYDFKSSLGVALGFSEDDVMNATHTDESIICKNTRNGIVESWEIIPSLAGPWLESQQFMYMRRKTRQKIFASINDGKSYTWPTQDTLQEIANSECVLMARGFMPKRGQNNKYEMQWEIALPKIEKVLNTKIPHPQMRAYLFLVTLFKTFIEPETERKGMLIDHIKTEMFWEFERDAYNWPDKRLGEKLVTIINNIYKILSKQKLSDYFNSEKNMLENIPGNQLRKAQRMLHDISERPFVHFLYALKNLHYKSDLDYPVLDFDQLYKIVNKSPQLNNVKQANVAVDPRRQGNSINEQDPEKLWKIRLIQANQEQRRKKREEEDARKLEEQQNLPRKSGDVDFMWSCKNLMSENPLQKRAILLFFLPHFIEIAKASLKFEDVRQARLYIRQSNYLLKLLGDCGSTEEDVERYQGSIQQLEEDAYKLELKNHKPPQVPDRNSFPMPQNILISNTRVNTNNLHNSQASLEVPFK